MITSNIYKKLILIFICITLIYIYFLIKNKYFTIPTHNIESKLIFIQQQKEITQKDFSFVMKQLKSQEENKDLINNSLQNKEEENTETKIPIKLQAIINNQALINEKWISLYETIEYNNKVYILQKITKHGIFLQNKEDKNDIFYLEIFTIPKELFLHIK